MDLKKLKFDYKKIGRQLVGYAARFHIILTVVAVGGLIGIAIWRIGAASNPEINQRRVEEKVSQLKRVKFDEEAIAQIQNLVDSNIDITSQFTDRNNPFEEN